jgi:hypothetical protein
LAKTRDGLTVTQIVQGSDGLSLLGGSLLHTRRQSTSEPHPGMMTWLRSLVDSGMLGKHVLMMKTMKIDCRV